MAAANYDPRKVVVTFVPNPATDVGSITISNFVAGTMITVERRVDARMLRVSPATGFGTFSKSNDRSASVTFEIEEGAPENAQLDAVLQRDEASGDGWGRFQLKDMQGDDQVNAPHCYITKAPPLIKGSEAGSRTYVIVAADATVRSRGLDVLA